MATCVLGEQGVLKATGNISARASHGISSTAYHALGALTRNEIHVQKLVLRQLAAFLEKWLPVQPVFADALRYERRLDQNWDYVNHGANPLVALLEYGKMIFRNTFLFRYDMLSSWGRGQECSLKNYNIELSCSWTEGNSFSIGSMGLDHSRSWGKSA